MGLKSKCLEREFPKLATGAYERHSPKDRAYNCIAFAAGDLFNNWDVGEYWPANEWGWKFMYLILVYEAVGFVSCDKDISIERGYEKVALYMLDGEWSHAARQRQDGWWESKLGGWDDIIHQRVDQVECEEYGAFELCMKRPLRMSIKARIEARSRANKRTTK